MSLRIGNTRDLRSGPGRRRRSAAVFTVGVTLMSALAALTVLTPIAASPTVVGSTISGRAYYVSPLGSDSNLGTSPSRAWRSVAQVNRAKLKPGDGVLFEGGQTFSDDTLMPGWGTGVSGDRGAPVVFGSYGRRNAVLPKGIWVKGEANLVFRNFDLGPDQGVSGTGNSITVEHCSIRNIIGTDAEFGIVVTNGSGWRIANNTIDHTGDSGMLLLGDHYTVSDNTITNTGLDPKITWGAHGIYLKATDSNVTGNTITNFRNEGISVRYRNSTITENHITGGELGIAWFQYDPTAGTSRWTKNTIAATTLAGIYISHHDLAGNTRESFEITSNTITKPTGNNAQTILAAGWQATNLKPTTGTYTEAPSQSPRHGGANGQGSLP